jgi:hypothetical protein
LTEVNVSRPPVPPASIPNQTASECAGYSYTVPAFADQNIDTLNYTFSGLPSWLKQSNVAVSPRYMPRTPPYTEATPDTPKVYTVTATANEPENLSASKSFNVTVTDAPAP